jgi:hypothetical protein
MWYVRSCVVLGNLKEGDHWEDIGMDGNIKLDTEDIGWGSMDWINLTEERDRLWALVYMVMNLWVP